MQGAAGKHTCDCALSDEWSLNADVVQDYRAVSARWLRGPDSDRVHASQGNSAP